QVIVPHVAEKIKNFDGMVIATRDTHQSDYLKTQEGRNLPVEHCIEGTVGWQICPEVAPLLKEEPIDKPAFGSVVLGERLRELNERETIESVTLIGLCTDICVISNAMILKANLPEVPILVDADCCAGVTVESHIRALEAMKVCQIQIVEEK
ncbi:MAG: cysteine hydrolase, partial [Acetatifactor sp.]|nr:cysteine hydrolase [Acetatifactor sp.]